MAAVKLGLIGLAGLTAFAVHGEALAGSADVFDDLFSPYLDRSDKVTPGAGNAKDTNAAAHVIDPWPPRVGDRHILYDGKRVGDAVHRYRKGPDPAAQTDPAGTPAGPAGNSGGGSASAPAQP